MFNDWHYMVVQDRMAREQDFAERRAERRRYTRSPGQPSLRARVARRLFELAVWRWSPSVRRPGALSGGGWSPEGACRAGAPQGGVSLGGQL